MFHELMPLLVQRALCITISRKAADEICLNVIPKKLKEGENEALTTPLTVTGSPKELDERLPNILVEFVGNHLELSSNLRTASEQMKAASQKAKEGKSSNKPSTAPDVQTGREQRCRRFLRFGSNEQFLCPCQRKFVRVIVNRRTVGSQGVERTFLNSRALRANRRVEPRVKPFLRYDPRLQQERPSPAFKEEPVAPRGESGSRWKIAVGLKTA